MESEIIIRVILALAGIIGAGKIIYEIISGGKSKLREEYKFAKEFLGDLSQDKELHPFVIEKGYQAIAGTTTVSSKEISYLLSLEKPVESIKDYVLSKKYLEHLNTNGNLQITFTKKYRSKWSRTWRKTFYLLMYFFGALIALSPFLLAKHFDLSIKQLLITSVFTIPIFSVLAFDSLRSFIKIFKSEDLVQNQSSHTKHI